MDGSSIRSYGMYEVEMDVLARYNSDNNGGDCDPDCDEGGGEYHDNSNWVLRC